MRYGIIEENLDVLCANCNEILSEDGSIPSNYCPHCGCPLTMEAIKETEKRNREIEKNIFYTLKDISDDLDSDSFKKVVKKYFDQD